MRLEMKYNSRRKNRTKIVLDDNQIKAIEYFKYKIENIESKTIDISYDIGGVIVSSTYIVKHVIRILDEILKDNIIRERHRPLLNGIKTIIQENSIRMKSSKEQMKLLHILKQWLIDEYCDGVLDGTCRANEIDVMENGVKKTKKLVRIFNVIESSIKHGRVHKTHTDMLNSIRDKYVTYRKIKNI